MPDLDKNAEASDLADRLARAFDLLRDDRDRWCRAAWRTLALAAALALGWLLTVLLFCLPID